jgi:glutathione S-transferase
MYKLYVIPGSHACRSAMLMLEYKEVPYRRVDIVTLMHPLVARLHGFDAGGQTRNAGGRRTFGLRLGDRLGTVPGLAANGHRVSTNHRIARFLDAHHPQPPLFPAEPEKRAAVEQAERWANETLQMAARRIPGAAIVRDPAAFSRRTGDGRLGYLLYKRALTRRLIFPRIARGVFAARPGA